MNELRSPHGTLHHLLILKDDTMTPKSIESSLQDLSIELLRSKIGQPLHLSQNVIGSWTGTPVRFLGGYVGTAPDPRAAPPCQFLSEIGVRGCVLGLKSSQVKLALAKFHRADSALRSQAAGGVGVCASVAPPAFGCRLG